MFLFGLADPFLFQNLEIFNANCFKSFKYCLFSAPLKESLEAIADIQSEIDRVNEKSSEEIINVEQKFNKLRKPVLAKRQTLVQNVSVFDNYIRANNPKIASWIRICRMHEIF